MPCWYTTVLRIRNPLPLPPSPIPASSCSPSVPHPLRDGVQQPSAVEAPTDPWLLASHMTWAITHRYCTQGFLRRLMPCAMFSHSMKPATRWSMSPASPAWGRKVKVLRPRLSRNLFSTYLCPGSGCQAE